MSVLISDTKLDALLWRNLDLERQLSSLSKEFIEADDVNHEQDLEFQVADLLAQVMNVRKQVMKQMQKEDISVPEISFHYDKILGSGTSPTFLLGQLDLDGNYLFNDLCYSTWYIRAMGGRLASQFNMGMIYLIGLGGIKPDLFEAHTWLERAGRQKCYTTSEELKVYRFAHYQLGHFQFIGTPVAEKVLREIEL